MPTHDLFEVTSKKHAPLATRMRPESLSEYAGQTHILGVGKLLTRTIESDRLVSLIFFGPPGCGKTTLANCVSLQTQSHFEFINAVSSNVEEMRKILLSARNRFATSSRKTLLFIDEIHRFNKAQQDVLMPDLEDGHVILIGATVFNPFFALTPPLLSRSMIFELKSLTQQEILTLLKRALHDEQKGLGFLKVNADPAALEFLAEICDGDARKALNALEIGCLTAPKNKDGVAQFDLKVAQESIQRKHINYDQTGDGHFDTASALIKSMRGSDPDATLYWMAKMLEAGEDPRFIARRICICAAEDVGNADPHALVLASAALQASEFIGLPEARIPLAQAAVYIACAPKSNAAYMGIEKAIQAVKEKRTQEVPDHLKDAHYSGARRLGHGQGYKYAHDYEGHFVKQEYMPLNERFYEPSDQGYEIKIKERLKKIRES